MSPAIKSNTDEKALSFWLIPLAIYRDVPGARIPGGSEDVLLDLAIRQLAKRFQEGVKLQQQQPKPKI